MPCLPRAQQVVRRAARRPRRRAASASRAGPGRRRRTGRRRGRWRRPCRRRAGSASAIARSIAPGSSGLGNADGREVRVGLLLLRHDAAARRSRRSPAPAAPRCRRRRGAACRRCEVARPVGGELGDGVEVAVDDVVAEHRAAGAARDVGQRARPRRSARRSRRRRAARSGCRRRGRPCSRCPAAGCGWRSPSRRRRSRARGSRTPAAASAAAAAAAAP